MLSVNNKVLSELSQEDLNIQDYFIIVFLGSVKVAKSKLNYNLYKIITCGQHFHQNICNTCALTM